MLITRYPPSEFIKSYMRYNHISQLELARATNIDLGMIKGILKNKVPITLEIADKLELSIGGHSQTWLRLQNDYNEYLKRKENRK